LGLLEAWPDVRLDTRLLTGEWAGHHRLRVGRYRIVFREEAPGIIYVVRIGPRGTSYR
jgi:mRNA-degrading endonuclease RelE of RelBE toxin-antitoxin system